MSDYINKVAEAVRGATIDCAWKFGARTVLRKPSLVDLAAIIASVPRPEPGIIYQIRLPGDSESIWRDATESAFWVTTEKNRRIVYAEPVAAQSTMLMEALHVALDVLDNVKGNINPERSYAYELECDVINASNKIQDVLSDMKDKEVR